MSDEKKDAADSPSKKKKGKLGKILLYLASPQTLTKTSELPLTDVTYLKAFRISYAGIRDSSGGIVSKRVIGLQVWHLLTLLRILQDLH